jgi:hypothetical protein
VKVRADFTKVRLERGSGNDWQLVCVAPCELTGDPFRLYQYRVAGIGIRTSEPFRVPPSSRDLVVDVKGSTRDRHMIGVAALAAGGGAIVAGLLYWGLSHVLATGGTRGYDAGTERSGREGALLLGAAGVLLEAAGILAISGHTAVQVHE